MNEGRVNLTDYRLNDWLSILGKHFSLLNNLQAGNAAYTAFC
jgi:hypothetical protein